MKKIYLSILVLSSLLVSSCSKFVEGYDKSPNNPTEATPSLMLSYLEVATWVHYTGELAREASVFTQQSAGTDGQYQAIGAYQLSETDLDDTWRSVYNNGLMNAQHLIELSGERYPIYRGLGKVFKAMNIILATDVWGDVPYTQALKGLSGESSYNPAYDSQSSIYDAVQTLLSDAITDLRRTDGVGAPAGDDYVFAGNASKWIAVAHALKARYYTHTSIKNSGDAAKALIEVDSARANGFTSAAADFNAIFGTTANTEENTWHAFNRVRGSYMHMGATLVDMLLNNTDPRLSFYCTTDGSGGYSGTPLNSTSQSSSSTGSYFAGAGNTPLPMVTYVENLFIEAEAAFRTGNPGRAATALNNAVIAHVTQVTGNPPSASFVTGNASWTAGTVTLDKIMTQKYIAMFTQFEVWNDVRRTGIPALTPITNQSTIPYRCVTPQNERLYNSSCNAVSDIHQKMWFQP